MIRLRTLPILTAVLVAQLAQAADLFPFVLPWDDASPSVTNISAWLDKPAGAAGFVQARSGHLFAGDKRLRIFGVNLAFGANFPTQGDAEKVAARMAKFGINCVRFHHMDTSFAPAGLLEKDKQTFNADALDRLDYFVAQLKKNGIYTNLNLHVGREYPGFEKWDGAPNFFKGVDNFFPPFIEQQEDYARRLLTHVNSYTGKAYVDEPSVALIEINNENGLIMEWNNGTLDAMPDPFAAAFQKQWNGWLEKKYGSQEKLAAAWTPGVEPLGDEMLKTARDAWSFEQHGSARATLAFEGGDASLPDQTMHVHVTQPDSEGWHVQVGQPGLTLAAGKTYTISLRAKADAPRKLTLNLSQSHEPWKVFATHTVELTREWQDIQFSAPVADAENKARLTISNLASATGDAWFVHPSVRSGGILGLKDGETLGTIPYFRKKEIGARTLTAQRDWNEFLVDTETRYWTGMQHFIRGDLHAHSLVVGSASGFSPWIVQSKLDVVDAHSYWQHPHFPHQQWDMKDWTVKNVSMAGAPDGGTLPGLALRRVAGKPFIVTEYNASAPNTYSSEAFLELCAIAGLQDWDGVFAFAYCHRTNDWDTRRIPSFFDIDQHPTKMATLPAALALFLRGDVQPPGPMKIIVAETDRGNALESIRTKGSWVDASAYGMTRDFTFRRALGMALVDHPVSADSLPRGSTFQGDTDEIRWDTTNRRMLIKTKLSAGVVGTLHPGEILDLYPVQMIPGATLQNWATINATVMDGPDFQHARRILVTATGLCENTGMRWKNADKSSVGRDWGSAPSLVEGIAAKISLPSIPDAKAWALDDLGHRKSEVSLQRSADHMEIQLSGEQQTLWWEIAAP